MNLQKPEPSADGDGGTLDLHSIFPTIQGEGPFTGHPAVFVRLAGCNLQCPGCDTEYTEGRRMVLVHEIVERVLDVAGPAKLVVITGGEPLRQDIGQLVLALITEKLHVQIESNGVLPPSKMLLHLLLHEGDHVSIVVSPKTSRISLDVARFAFAFKYVLDADSIDPDDGLPIRALDHKAVPRIARPLDMEDTLIYLNPCDTGDVAHNARNLAAVVQSCMQHGYIAGVQLHKLMNVE